MTWWQLVLQLLITAVAVIPLVVEVVKYVKENAKERNWSNIVKLIFDLCVQAEEEIMDGAGRKEWVMDMLNSLASSVGYDLSDEEMVAKVNDLIDSFITATKYINVN